MRDAGPTRNSTSGARYFEVESELSSPIVVLKPINHDNGPKMLINELVCTELAYRLGLPCREPLLVDVPASLAKKVRLRGGQRMTAGLSFGVEVIKGQSPPAPIQVELADNRPHIPGIVAFDTWVGNRDRNHGGNLIGGPSPDKPGQYRIWMIDHGDCITGDTWTAGSSELSGNVRVESYLSVLESGIQTERDQFEYWTDKIARIEESEIEAVVNLVPESWLLGDPERAALIRFLTDRRSRIWPVLAARFALEQAGD